MADSFEKVLEEPESKKSRKEDKEVVSVNESLNNFKDFKLAKILSEGTLSKSVNLLCKVDGVVDKEDAVVILEKTAFSEGDIKGMLCAETSLKQLLHNDIYGTYTCSVEPTYNAVKATIIHPATDKHIQKYSSHTMNIVNETYEDYVKYTQPYIESKAQLSLQWVENILNHKREQDRIIFEDADPVVGFILLPDMKWNRERVEDLYVVAIVHRRALRSIRQLTTEHLSLLKNIREKSVLTIWEKYGVPQHQLRIFVHYQPSYYHFHVHFTHIGGGGSDSLSGGIQCTRAHLLDSIIDNIEMKPDYYQVARLTYQVIKDDPLWEMFEKGGKFSVETAKTAI